MDDLNFLIQFLVNPEWFLLAFVRWKHAEVETITCAQNIETERSVTDTSMWINQRRRLRQLATICYLPNHF